MATGCFCTTCRSNAWRSPCISSTSARKTAAGETAPVMLTGVATFKMIDGNGLFLYHLQEQCMALSMHLFYIRTQDSGRRNRAGHVDRCGHVQDDRWQRAVSLPLAGAMHGALHASLLHPHASQRPAKPRRSC